MKRNLDFLADLGGVVLIFYYFCMFALAVALVVLGFGAAAFTDYREETNCAQKIGHTVTFIMMILVMMPIIIIH